VAVVVVVAAETSGQEGRVAAEQESPGVAELAFAARLGQEGLVVAAAAAAAAA